MRTPLGVAAGLAATLALGCAGGGNPAAPSAAEAPLGPDPAAPSTLGAIRSAGDLSQGALGLYRVHVDLDTLTGSVELLQQREAAQSEIYALEIGAFLTSDSVTIDGVSLGAGTVDIRYTTRHPFPSASDLLGEASSFNREDLAVTGRVLWLLEDEDSSVFFPGDGDIRANTSLVVNPDGYFAPQGMVDLGSLAANTFPYQLLVDETRNNRVGVDNGGLPTGNYPGTTSWSVAEFTTGITGYGIWAQGQASENTLSVDLAALTGGASFTTDLAILVKYEDPRAGANAAEKRSNRLPPPTADMSYRLPHAAQDVEAILNVTSTPGFTPSIPSSSTIACAVRDWDSGATEHTATNLAGVVDTSLVSAGESGLPVLDVSIPGIGLTADTLTPTGGGESGHAGDEITYSGIVSGTPTAPNSVITGLVRATDVVDITPPVDWDLNHFNLEPGGTLVPLAAHFEGATYQAFDVLVGPPPGTPEATVTVDNSPILNGGTLNVRVSGYSDPENDPIEVLIDWADNGNFTDPGDFGNIVPGAGGPDVIFSSPSGYTYAGTPPNNEVRDLPVEYTDNDTPPVVVSGLTFEVMQLATRITLNPLSSINPDQGASNISSQVGQQPDIMYSEGNGDVYYMNRLSTATWGLTFYKSTNGGTSWAAPAAARIEIAAAQTMSSNGCSVSALDSGQPICAFIDSGADLNFLSAIGEAATTIDFGQVGTTTTRGREINIDGTWIQPNVLPHPTTANRVYVIAHQDNAAAPTDPLSMGLFRTDDANTAAPTFTYLGRADTLVPMSDNDNVIGDIDSAGDVHLVWEGDTTLASANEQIVYREFLDASSTWATAAEVVLSTNANSGDVEFPYIALNASDEPVVAWHDSVAFTGFTDRYIYFTKKNGATWTAPQIAGNPAAVFQGSGNFQTFPQVAVDNLGRLHMLWRDERDGTGTLMDGFFGVWGTVWSANGAVKLEPDFAIIPGRSLTDTVTNPRLEFDDSGDRLLVTCFANGTTAGMYGATGRAAYRTYTMVP